MILTQTITLRSWVHQSLWQHDKSIASEEEEAAMLHRNIEQDYKIEAPFQHRRRNTKGEITQLQLKEKSLPHCTHAAAKPF